MDPEDPRALLFDGVAVPTGREPARRGTVVWMMAPLAPEIPFAAPEALAAAPPGWWFFGMPPRVQGPIDAEALRNLIRARRLDPATLVWSQGMPAFAPASTIPSLDMNDEFTMGLLVPTGPQSAVSIVAGYLALFGVLIWPLGLFGIITGVFGLRDLKANPHKRGYGRALTGIILGGLETVGLLLFLFAVVFKPH